MKIWRFSEFSFFWTFFKFSRMAVTLRYSAVYHLKALFQAVLTMYGTYMRSSRKAYKSRLKIVILLLWCLLVSWKLYLLKSHQKTSKMVENLHKTWAQLDKKFLFWLFMVSLSQSRFKQKMLIYQIFHFLIFDLRLLF